MSHTLAFGDSVTVDTSSDEGGIIYPLNDLYPLNPCIVDIGSDGLPIAYCPYRVYPGDICLIKDTEEGPALIPEEMSGKGTFSNTQSSVATIWATEQCSSNGAIIYCSGCSYNKNNKCDGGGGGSYYTGSTHRANWTPGFTGRGPCSNYEFLGWNVTGGNSIIGGLAADCRLYLNAVNAYEYAKISMSSAIPKNGSNSKYDPCIVLMDRSASVIRSLNYSINGTEITVEAYPGYGGTLGQSNIDGSQAVIQCYCEIGGGYGVSRTEYSLSYLPRSVYITLTFTGTGRYGNLQ